MKRWRLDWRFWGWGVYVNLSQYRYLALQVGPLWLYLVTQGGLLEGTVKRLSKAVRAIDNEH